MNDNIRDQNRGGRKERYLRKKIPETTYLQLSLPKDRRISVASD